jgi:hypothetical protein
VEARGKGKSVEARGKGKSVEARGKGKSVEARGKGKWMVKLQGWGFFLGFLGFVVACLIIHRFGPDSYFPLSSDYNQEGGVVENGAGVKRKQNDLDPCNGPDKDGPDDGDGCKHCASAKVQDCASYIDGNCYYAFKERKLSIAISVLVFLVVAAIGFTWPTENPILKRGLYKMVFPSKKDASPGSASAAPAAMVPAAAATPAAVAAAALAAATPAAATPAAVAAAAPVN